MNRRFGRDLLLAIAAFQLLPHRLRVPFYRFAGLSIGSGVFVMDGIRVSRSARIQIGDNVFINRGCYFDAASEIAIGAGVRMADGVRLITSTHEFGSRAQRGGRGVSRPILVGAGVWLGSSVIVLPGVKISEGCVIAAGAVVTKDTLANGLYAGIPARRIRSLD